MKIAICDDEKECRDTASDLIAEYAEKRKDRDISFSIFSDPSTLLEADSFDIYILDIVMPSMSGIELGRRLRSRGIDSKIIFLTSGSEYALDSFSVRAFDYLLKPVEPSALFRTLDEASSSLKAKYEKSIMIKTKECTARVALDSILFAELSGRSITYQLLDGRSLSTTSIRTNFTEAVKELLNDRRFSLCGASLAANMHHITSVEKDGIVFSNGMKRFLGVKACRDARTLWNDFWLSEDM